MSSPFPIRTGEPEELEAQQNPLQEVSPIEEDGGDLGELHLQRQARLEREKRAARARAALAAKRAAETPAPAVEPAFPAEPSEIPAETSQNFDPGGMPTPEQEAGLDTQSGERLLAIGQDIAGGLRPLTSVAPQIFGGIQDAMDSLSKLMIEQGLRPDLEGIPEKQLQKMLPPAQTLPKVPEADTVTGGVIRNIAQFSAGFLTTGRIKAARELAQLGNVGQVASAALRGLVADFAVFDPQEERLSNLVQEFPALANPVTEYLAAAPGDPADEGRLKNALEGLGLGVATDLLGRGLRTLRAARRARVAAGVTPEATDQVLRQTQIQREQLEHLMGGPMDPAAPRFEIRAPDDVSRGIEAARRKGAKAQPAGDVYVNWSRINDEDDVKSLIQEMADARASDINKARRGVRPWRETKLAAEELDAWEILSQRRSGEPLNAEQATAVRELWHSSARKVYELGNQLGSDPGSELKRLAFRKQLAIHQTVQEQVVAARTETARALNAWGMRLGSNAEMTSQIDQLIGLASRDRDTTDLAARIVSMVDSGKFKEADAFAYASRWAKGSDMIRQLYYSAMLSSPHTHVRNLIGNSAAIAMQMGERKMANLLGKFLGEPNVVDGEAAAQWFGMVQGFKDAFRFTAKGRQVFRTARRLRIKGDHEAARELVEANRDEMGTLFQSVASGAEIAGNARPELIRQGAADPAKIGLDAATPLGRVMAWVDSTTTAPMRALQASDEVFKSATWNMELRAQAVRKARNEVRSGLISESRYQDRVTTLVADPDESMRMAAQRFAEVSTFTQRPMDTPLWQAFSKVGRVPLLGKILLPFVRTPYNIGTFTFQRTPIGPAMKSFQAELRAGGAAADLAYTRMLTGSAILAGMADLAMAGVLTGEGPENPAEKATQRRLGWQRNSAKVGDRYFSYRGLEPISTSLTIAANAVDILRYSDWEDDDAQLDEMFMAIAMGFAANVTAQQYMSGVSAFFEVMSDSQRYGENWWERLAASPIPRGLSMLNSDRTMRETVNVVDAVRARIPGLSASLPAYRNLWGEEITRASGLGSLYDFVSPIYSSSAANPEPIDLELNRLELWIGKPGKSLNIDGVSKSLRNEPEIYSRWVELSGNAMTHDKYGAPVDVSGKGLKDALNDLVQGRHPLSQLYELGTDGPDGGKAKMIEGMVQTFRNASKDQLLEEFPELNAEMDRRRSERSGLQLQLR